MDMDQWYMAALVEYGSGSGIRQCWWYMAAVVVYGYGSVVVYGYGLVVVYGYGCKAVADICRAMEHGLVANL